MATNPRLPDKNNPNPIRPTLVEQPERPKSAVPGVALAIITAALLLAAIFYFMPHHRAVNPPAAAAVPLQPVPGQLQFSDMNMTLDPTGQALELDGEVTNTSNDTITGIMAQVQFTLKNGGVANVSAPVSAILVNGKANAGKINGSVANMVSSPIKPSQERPIMINVARVPADWNHTMPGLVVASTTGYPGNPPKQQH